MNEKTVLELELDLTKARGEIWGRLEDYKRRAASVGSQADGELLVWAGEFLSLLNIEEVYLAHEVLMGADDCTIWCRYKLDEVMQVLGMVTRAAAVIELRAMHRLEGQQEPSEKQRKLVQMMGLLRSPMLCATLIRFVVMHAIHVGDLDLEEVACAWVGAGLASGQWPSLWLEPLMTFGQEEDDDG